MSRDDAPGIPINETQRLGELGRVVLYLEQEVSTNRFWWRIGLVKLALWFKEWSQDKTIRDESCKELEC